MKSVPETIDELYSAVLSVVGRRCCVKIDHTAWFYSHDAERCPVWIWNIYVDQFGGSGFSGSTAAEALDKFLLAERDAKNYQKPGEDVVSASPGTF